MQLIINGQTRQFNEQLNTDSTALTLSELIETLGFKGTRYAIEVNGFIIPRSKHSSYRVQDNEKIEIIQAVGGG